MKLLLTGATGFLGSQLLRAFLAASHDMIILKRSTSDTRRIDDLEGRFVSCDIDSTPLAELFMKHGPFDAVVHTATCYGRKGESAGTIFAANTVFPAQLLDCCRSGGAQLFLNTDTSLPKGVNTYAFSKRQFSEWGTFTAESGRVRFINLVTEHFYGPGDDDGKITSLLIRSCLADVPSLQLSFGEQQRDFIYIDDVVAAFLAVLGSETVASGPAAVYEIGSGATIAIRDLAELIRRITGTSTRLDFGAIPYRANEVMVSCADTTALRQLGWQPTVSLEEGLRRTIESERMEEKTL